MKGLIRNTVSLDTPLGRQHIREQEAKVPDVSADYEAFLTTKAPVVEAVGREVPAGDIHPALYGFQSAIVQWATRRGRAAVWADCGLGKTIMQLEWARHIDGPTLIVAPLNVAYQTIAEASKMLGLDVRYAPHPDQLQGGVSITNYERIKHFTKSTLAGIVLDESSILKSIDGETRTLLLEEFTGIPWRLCCTATPAPNDISELANHAEFLGVMKREEMLGTFFVHDDEGWRLRGHARTAFFQWLAQWAMAVRSPADLGFDATGFVLPELEIRDVVVPTSWRKDGNLFAGGLSGITDRAAVRKASVAERVAAAGKIAKETSGQVIVWCGLNDESEAVAAALGDDAVEVSGSDSPEAKAADLLAFADGKHRVLVSKSKIAGFGMNFQNASTMVFVGLSDSYESYYQCIRREWRYGQKQKVVVHIVVTDHETEIVANVRRKESEAARLAQEIVDAAKGYQMDEIKKSTRQIETTERARFSGEGWDLFQGDCVEELRELPANSIDFSVFSPPFIALYTYSGTERDMGNAKNEDEFFGHFRFCIRELLRVTNPGRNCAVHVAQVPAMLGKDGWIGLKDFRGSVVEQFVREGWIYHGEVVLDKDPQAQAIRTHAKGLLFAQLKKDSTWLRPALADYILVFRKPGENAKPVQPDISHEEWIQWARPIWYGIRESDTLNVAEARSAEDDRHVCPLQLGTIERCIRLWSNPGDVVLSPFAGIGSEGYVSLQHGRKFIGIELKPLYARTAVKNLGRAVRALGQGSMFGNS